MRFRVFCKYSEVGEKLRGWYLHNSWKIATCMVISLMYVKSWFPGTLIIHMYLWNLTKRVRVIVFKILILLQINRSLNVNDNYWMCFCSSGKIHFLLLRNGASSEEQEKFQLVSSHTAPDINCLAVANGYWCSIFCTMFFGKQCCLWRAWVFSSHCKSPWKSFLFITRMQL